MANPSKEIKVVPSFEEVMREDPSKKKVPSYEEVMGIEKKNLSGTTSKNVGVPASPSPLPSDGDLKKVDLGNPPEFDTNDGNSPADDTDPFANIKYINELEGKKTTHAADAEIGGDYETPDADAAALAKEKRKALNKAGFDDDFLDSISDFPQEALDHDINSKQAIVDLYKTNPLKASQLINETKNHWAVRKAAEEKSDGTPYQRSQNAIIAANEYTGDVHPQNMDELYGTIEKKKDVINHVLTGEDRDKANQRLQNSYSLYINSTAPDFQQEYASSEFKDKLDPNQYAGLKTLQLFKPEEYKQAVEILKTNKPTEFELHQGLSFGKDGFTLNQTNEKETDESVNYKRGLEIVSKKLADIGRDNLKRSLYRNIYQLKQDAQGKSPEELMQLQGELDKNYNTLSALNTDVIKDDERYPLSAQLKFDDQTKELTQKAGMNALEYGAYHFGKGFEKSQNSVGNIITNIFGSDADKAERAATALGQSAEDASTSYLPTNLRSEQPSVIYKFPKEVEAKRDAILSDNNIPEEEKQRQLTELIEKHKGEINTITNPNAGKHANFFSKATLYGNAATIGDIASIAAQSAGLGAVGAGRLISAAAPMFTTTQDDFYKEAIAQGKSISEASSYANTHATIMALAGLINPDLNIVKRSIGLNTIAGKTIAGIDEATWDAVVNSNKPLLQKIKNSATSVGKEALKMGTVYGAGTSLASDIADNALYNGNNSFGDIVDHAAKATRDITLNSMALFGINAISNFKSVSPEQKARLWELGTNKEIGLQQIQDEVKLGKLSPQKADQYKKIITDVSSLIEQVPTENEKGKPLNDKQKVDYLYNLIAKSKAKELSSTLPPKAAEKAEALGKVAEYKNDIILSNPTDIQLENQHKSLEKELAGEKDANGNTKEIPEKRRIEIVSQMEAIKDIQDERTKSKTTEPIQPNESGKESESKSGTENKVSESTDGSGQGIAETPAPVLEDRAKNADVMREILQDTSTSKDANQLLLQERGDIGDAITEYEEGKIDGSALKKVFVDNNVPEEYISRKLAEVGMTHDLSLPENISSSKTTAPPTTVPDNKGAVDMGLDKAKELVNSGVVKGFTSDVLKEAANNDPEQFKSHLKDIAEQANDPRSNETTVKTYGKELTDIAQRMFPEENKGTDIPKPTEESIPPIEPPKESGSGAKEGEDGKVTGVKKSITSETRTALGLPKVEFPKMGGDMGELEAAKKRIDSGEVNPIDLVTRILSEKSGYKNEQEVFDMQYFAHQLSKHSEELDRQYAEADTPEAKAEVLSKKQQLSDIYDAQTEAAQLAGNKWGKVGNAMQPVIDMGFNIFRQKADIKEAYGGEIPADVKERLDKITQERDEALAQKTKVEEQLRQRMAKEGMGKAAKDAAKSKSRSETKENLQKEASDLIQQLKDEIKGNPNDPQRHGAPITDKMVVLVGKLAVNYLKQGVNGLEALVDRIHEQLKDTGIERNQVKNAIANYEPYQAESEIKRLNKKADLLDDKVAPPTLNKKGAPSEKVDLNKPSREYKTFRSNTEWVKANQRVANAEHAMKIEKRKAFESQKNIYQKGVAWAGRLVRLSVLSGYHVLGKLAAAATIGAAAKRPFEQGAGAFYSKIFKGIAEKAPIESNLNWSNASAEAKFYKEFFNPKKFVKNSWEILKTGSSNLGKRLGGAEYEHVPFLYIPTDLHQIIKDPVKRATFEASFKNGLIWAEKNGLDINDNLVINSIENAAYKRAQYEIFQESNTFSRWFTSQKANLEKKGNTGATAKFLVDFLIPVSTVPTNIVRRLITSSPLGLIRGGKEVVQAYRKGIESLTNEQADHVMQQLKQGTLGTALWLVGWYGANQFGGLYSKYNPNKQRKEGDLASDEMAVGGKMIPKPVQHALPLEIIQFAATARHVYDNYINNKNATTPEALYNAGMASIGALTEQVPVVETASHLVQAAGNPYEAGKLKEDLTRRVQPQILRETGVIGGAKSTPEMKYLSDKGLKIVDVHKESLSPVDESGKKIFVTTDKFEKLQKVREEKIQEEVSALMKNGAVIWEEGKQIPAKDLSKKQLESWLMKTSTKATKDATEEVFGKQPEKESEPSIETMQ